MSNARRGVSPTVAVELSKSLLNNKCSEVGRSPLQLDKHGTIVNNILRLNIYAFEPVQAGGHTERISALRFSSN